MSGFDLVSVFNWLIVDSDFPITWIWIVFDFLNVLLEFIFICFEFCFGLYFISFAFDKVLKKNDKTFSITICWDEMEFKLFRSTFSCNRLNYYFIGFFD